MSQQQQSKCVATAATDTVVLLPRDDDDSSRNTASSRRCKLLLVTALILCSGLLCLCLALIVLVAFSGRMSACPDVDVSVVSGVFLLQRFGSDFDNYLQSLDIPEHVFPLVKNSSELLEVSTDADCYWQVYMRTDYGDHLLRFLPDRPFVVRHGDQGDRLGYLCSFPAESILTCTAESTSKTLRSTMRFSPSGFVEEKTNLRSGVTGTKVYLRIWEEEEDHQSLGNGRLLDRLDEYDLQDSDLEEWEL